MGFDFDITGRARPSSLTAGGLDQTPGADHASEVLQYPATRMNHAVLTRLSNSQLRCQ
jgi:hypothetical protein